jgi:hypothetical protein
MRYSLPEITDIRKKASELKNHGKRSFRLKRWVRLILLGFLIIGVTWFFNSFPFFFIRSVEIQSDRGISSEYIKATFRPDDLVGLHFLYIPVKSLKNCFKSEPLVRSVKINRWNPGILKIHVISEIPAAYIIRPWGFYVINQDGKYLDIVPPFFKVDKPVKFCDENLLFNDISQPREIPWVDIVSKSDLSDESLMIALGYRDLMALRELIDEESGLPEIQYLGYDDQYGLVLKCRNEPVILIGYGKDLSMNFHKARRILMDPEFPDHDNEDVYVDLRFSEFQSVKNVSKLPVLFH